MGVMEDKQKITDLFETDPKRIEKFTHKLKIGDEFLYFDYTKTHVTAMTLHDMIYNFEALSHKNDMFDKALVNFTEGKKVLHVTLRSPEVLKAIQTNQNGDDL